MFQIASLLNSLLHTSYTSGECGTIRQNNRKVYRAIYIYKRKIHQRSGIKVNCFQYYQIFRGIKIMNYKGTNSSAILKSLYHISRQRIACKGI